MSRDHTGKLKKTWMLGSSRPGGNTIQCGPISESTIWGKSIKYMRRQMLKILAGHMMGGGHRPPCGHSSCGPLVFSAFASVCILICCPNLRFLILPHIVFSAIGPYCISCRVFYQLPGTFRFKPSALSFWKHLGRHSTGLIRCSIRF